LSGDDKLIALYSNKSFSKKGQKIDDGLYYTVYDKQKYYLCCFYFDVFVFVSCLSLYALLPSFSLTEQRISQCARWGVCAVLWDYAMEQESAGLGNSK
jgi:hypothetical protein